MRAAQSPEEKVFEVAFVVACFAFIGAGLAEVGRRIEKRVGPDAPRSVKRASPAALLIQALTVYMNQPGARARMRNVCLLIGISAVTVCAVALGYGVHHHAR